MLHQCNKLGLSNFSHNMLTINVTLSEHDRCVCRAPYTSCHRLLLLLLSADMHTITNNANRHVDVRKLSNLDYLSSMYHGSK